MIQPSHKRTLIVFTIIDERARRRLVFATRRSNQSVDDPTIAQAHTDRVRHR
jgi:hypothetical protein